MSNLPPFLNLACLIFITLLLLKSALHKAFDFLEFQGFVADYALVPEKFTKYFSSILVGLEFMVVVMIVFTPFHIIGLMLAISLFAIYAIAIGINLQRGRTKVECGCGGAPQLLSTRLLWRNAVLILAAIMPLGGIPAELTVLDTLIVMAAAIFMWVLYGLVEQTNANLSFIKFKQL